MRRSTLFSVGLNVILGIENDIPACGGAITAPFDVTEYRLGVPQNVIPGYPVNMMTDTDQVQISYHDTVIATSISQGSISSILYSGYTGMHDEAILHFRLLKTVLLLANML